MQDDTPNNDDQFLTNNPDDTNPMADITNDQQLPEDHATPFSPPDDEISHVDDTHPSTDTGIVAAETYDEGIEGAAETSPLSDSSESDESSEEDQTLPVA